MRIGDVGGVSRRQGEDFFLGKDLLSREKAGDLGREKEIG